MAEIQGTVATTPLELLDQLLLGDTSGLSTCPPEWLDEVRKPFKDITTQREEDLVKHNNEIYDQITAEMARKGIPY